ncbi:hypothetical protein [Micromonospora sp. CNB394]|uniref:hypothetical protein n=1 Tax=Micromonospora sp. CNB394 TaxID=1169151 RepID=UPI000363E137|nr:hypothetical protein [Micromonospora sp. CNB394]
MTDTDARLSATPRATLRRMKEKGHRDRAALFDVLRAAFVCHLGVLVNGGPMVGVHRPVLDTAPPRTLRRATSTPIRSLSRSAASRSARSRTAPAPPPMSTMRPGCTYRRTESHLRCAAEANASTYVR